LCFYNLAVVNKFNQVNLDIVSFGEDEANQAKLTAFINTLNGKDGSGSHLVRISSGNNLDQALRQSPISMSELFSTNITEF
jgi:26S proteasome regulatory subunit N10